jgi:hypothetical protein
VLYPSRSKGWLFRHGVLLGLALALLGGGAGCATAPGLATVKPHQRELLADRIMSLDGDAQERAADQHMLSNREGAVGGSGTSGGGCGCN